MTAAAMAEPRVAAGPLSVRDVLIVAALVVATLLPFLGKAFHIDDPMVVWSALKILDAPLDFYGLTVNWHGFAEPMWIANNNPPLSGYAIAAIAAVGGFGERVLHLGMMGPAVVLAVGSYLLARRLTASPRTAALATWTMPVVLVSSTGLVAEALLLAAWVVGMWLWIEGLARERAILLWAAGGVIGLCVLTKYIGIALVPLLLVYTLARRRWPGAGILALAIPVAMLAAFEIYMRFQYDHSPLTYVGNQSLSFKAKTGEAGVARQVIVGLSYFGGCVLTALWFTPLLWTRRGLLVWASLLVLAVPVVSLFGELARLQLRSGEVVHWLPAFQIGLFNVVALQVFALAAIDLWRARDADALMLALWVAGVFVFAAFLNWSVTARALMPAAPAVAILLARRFDALRAPGAADRSLASLLALAPALVVALAVAWADARLAGSSRTAAATLVERYGRTDHTLWFQGAWGFQVYMERGGARKLDYKRDTLMPGDLLVSPANNTNVLDLPLDVGVPAGREVVPAGRWVATMQLPPVGAGFYSDGWGPLPFALCDASPQVYHVTEIRRPFRPFAEASSPLRRGVDSFAPPAREAD